MQAVRVPPSACKTWQSTANVCGPIRLKSIAARSDRPMSRWISVPRESVCPIFGQGFRCGVDPGNITYSAVTHPPARRSSNQGGNSAATDTVQSTTVFP